MAEAGMNDSGSALSSLKVEQKDSNRPQLSTVIALFKNLSDADKVSALRFINRIAEGTDEILLTPTSSQFAYAVDDAHSCYHCARLEIGPKTEYYTIRRERIPVHRTLGSLQLTKHDLVQGIEHGCLLFRWIFRLLETRCLTKFKSDLAAHRLGPRRVEDLGKPTDNLDYIDTQSGITVTLSIDDAGRGTTLQIAFNVDPVLVDQLWDALSFEKRSTQRYEEFIKDCGTNGTATEFRVLTSHGTLDVTTCNTGWT